MEDNQTLGVRPGFTGHSLGVSYIVISEFTAALVIAANLLTIIAISKYEFLQTTSNKFVLSLACADLLLGLTLPYCSIRVFYPEALEYDGGSYEKYSCLVCQWFLAVTVASSLLTYTGIAVERYTAIVVPFAYPTRFSELRSNVFIVCLWTYAVVGITITSYFNHWAPNGECIFTKVLYDVEFLYGIVISNMITLVTIITTLYSVIFYIARKQQKQIQNEQITISGDAHVARKSDLKIFKVMVTVYGLLIVCYLPYWIANIIVVTFSSKPFWVLVLEKYAGLLLYCNSFCNAFVYGWKSKEFRKAYKIILCSWRHADVSSIFSQSS